MRMSALPPYRFIQANIAEPETDELVCHLALTLHSKDNRERQSPDFAYALAGKLDIGAGSCAGIVNDHVSQGNPVVPQTDKLASGFVFITA